jgi:membrane protease YdiL (CAAX protease family)
MSQDRTSFAPSCPPTPTTPIGATATLAWGVVGILATFCYFVIARVAQWTGASFPLPKSADLLPLSHVLLALVVILAIAAARRPILAYLALTRPRRGDLLRAVGLGVLAFVLLGVFYAGLAKLKSALGTDPVPALPDTLTGARKDFGTLAVVVSLWLGMVVAAPIAEEIFYRGFLYRGLAATRLGAAGAIALTSIVFGFAHAPGFGWERVLGTGLTGAFLCVLRWRSDSTLVPIIVHTTINLLGATAITLVLVTT